MEPWSVAHGLPPTQLYPMLSPTPCLTLAADSPGGASCPAQDSRTGGTDRLKTRSQWPGSASLVTVLPGTHGL